MNKLFFQFIISLRVQKKSHNLSEVHAHCRTYTPKHTNYIKPPVWSFKFNRPRAKRVFGSLPPTPRLENHNRALLTCKPLVFCDKCYITVPSGLDYSVSLKNVTIICLQPALPDPFPVLSAIF